MKKLSRQRKKKLIAGILAILILAGILIIFSVFSPSDIVERLGTENSLIVLLVLSLFASVSALTAGPFYLAFVGFIQGGLSPVLAVLIAAPGAIIGDYIFFYLISRGVDGIVGQDPRVQRFAAWVAARPSWMVPVITYFYFAFVPLASELFLSALAIAKVSRRRLILPMTLGIVTFFSILAYTSYLTIPEVQTLIGVFS